MSFKVFSDRKDNLLYRIQIAAAYSGAKLDVVENASAASKAPLPKLPVLETDKGVLFEADAIARFVARQGKTHLFGATPFEEGLVESWIAFATHEIELPVAVWVLPVLGRIPSNPAAVSRAKTDLQRVLSTLDKHLLTRTYLVGERITLADIIVSMSLFHAFEYVIDSSFRKGIQNVTRWYLTCVNQSQFKSVLGEVRLAEKEAAPGEHANSSSTSAAAAAPKEDKKKDEKKKDEKKEKKEEKKDEKKKDEKKEKKEEKKDEKKEKKEEKKEEKKPKKKEEEEEEEEPSFDEPKKKNPLDLLPPSKFVMDEWKRFYSNNETTDSIPWFFERYDPEGYSLWFADYKYNEENEVDYKVANLLGGFMQRLENMRKYAFGSLCIFSDKAPYEISTCWLFRGKDFPEGMKEVEDSELYTWRKADPTNAADKQLISDFWAWEGTFGGRKTKFNQGKIFK